MEPGNRFGERKLKEISRLKVGDGKEYAVIVDRNGEACFVEVLENIFIIAQQENKKIDIGKEAI